MKKATAVTLLLIAFMILTVAPIFAFAQNVKTYIPVNAKKYVPEYCKVVKRLDPTTMYPQYYPGLTEHESCISLTSKRCFDPTSSFKTDKEEGGGLGQATRKFDKNTGKVTADYLEDLRKRHMQELKDLSWKNLYERPDLQMTQVVLQITDNKKIFWQVKSEAERYKFADAAYNGGPGHTSKERLQCGLTKGCDPQVWFDNVETIKSVKGLKPLYGNRSPWDINRHHVDDVWNNRMTKYIPLMQCE